MNFGSKLLGVISKQRGFRVTKLRVRFIVIAGLLSFCLLSGGCTSSPDLDACLNPVVKPYRFSIVEWELQALSNELSRSIGGSGGEVDDEASVVVEYFSAIERLKTLESEIGAVKAGNGQSNLALLEAELNVLQEQVMALDSRVERLIEKQIKETLAQLGVYNPMDNYLSLEINFPPVNFILEKPPHLLVISPRDRIESIREVTLIQDLSLEEMEGIENELDELDVSSLVTGIGGIATYPAFVTNDASLRFTLDAATEEWLHQYLFFKPLGFLYALDLIGISQNYDIATMNETVVGIASKEIGAIIMENYYPRRENGDSQPPGGEPEFDFNQEMREIRRAVDKYLAQGEIEQAEEFMEQKRRFLLSKGYYIRKLNQAYFAFYGTYADEPTSISPIGLELKALRGQSASLKDFLDAASEMNSRQDLIDSVK